MIVANDPLLSGHIGWAVVGIVALKVLITFAVLLVAVMMMIWFERKIVSDFQNRIGPNRTGPYGLLQSLADGIKLFFKEDLIPDGADRWVFKLAPYLALVPAFLTFAVIPVGGDFSASHGGTISVFGHHTYMQLADPPIGVLFILAMSSIAVYGVLLAGWASGSKYPLLGAVRASAQMVSYEAALGLSVAAVFLVTGQLSTSGIVAKQEPWKWNLWVTGVVPFVIFFIAGLAEANRPPFDLVEAEQELTGGFNTEYSSIRFAMFYLAEFMNAVTLAAIIVTLFLGGPNGWYPSAGPTWLYGMIWFLLKLLVLLYVLVWIRGTLPRLRYDQLMDLGWKLLIPLSLGWLLLLVAVRVGNERGWHVYFVIPIAVVVMAAVSGLFAGAMRQSRRTRELGELAEVLD
jgi:NADH-quinone oxidoreductase subunit H